MTNVKLKLIFFLLSALLTADVVNTRPYSNSNNNTDIILNYSSNDTYLPVESDSDTLIVATDEQIRESNKAANNNMEAIMNAEHDRDMDLSKKTMKEQPKVLNVPKKDAVALQKQMNISSPTLEEIIDAETDREETLTDHLFKTPEAELTDDMPRFEFLIASKINESYVANSSMTTKFSGLSDNNLERNKSDLLRKVDYVELVEVLNVGTKDNKSAYNLANMTAQEVDNDIAPDTRFSDMQTLFLACIGTLVPLFLVLCATLIIRCICRRCCRKQVESSDSESSEKDDTSQQQLKSPAEDSRDSGEAVENNAPHSNGSIITMTLKNNHLIVETEERNDITKNGRETKMKYSPDNDGIFVVEVQQSAVYRSTTIQKMSGSPPADPQISTNQALIHRVAEDLETKTTEDDTENKTSDKYEKALGLSSTGLSISDLSMSSIGSNNVSYSYGGQIGYEHGPFGYPVYAGYEIPKDNHDVSIIHDNSQEPLICKTPTDPDKPFVTAAIFKQDSIICNDVLQSPGYCIEGCSDGPLLSDVQAREVSLQHLHDQLEKKLENGIPVPIEEKISEEPKHLVRADTLPEKESPGSPNLDKMDTINENEIPRDILKIKRASLPIIRTEMYDAVKDALNPAGSPKFEKFSKERSPSDSALNNPPPLITITEECDSSNVNDDS